MESTISTKGLKAKLNRQQGITVIETLAPQRSKRNAVRGVWQLPLSQALLVKAKCEGKRAQESQKRTGKAEESSWSQRVDWPCKERYCLQQSGRGCA
jgi:hypothetical protein